MSWGFQTRSEGQGCKFQASRSRNKGTLKDLKVHDRCAKAAL